MTFDDELEICVTGDMLAKLVKDYGLRGSEIREENLNIQGYQKSVMAAPTKLSMAIISLDIECRSS